MQEFSTNLGLSILPEMESREQPSIYAELLRIRNALRVLQSALDVYTGALSADINYWNQTPPSSSVRVQGVSRVYAITSEAISLGQLVNLYDVAGIMTARKANATDGTKPCRAYCSVSGGVALGAYGEFILLGLLRTVGVTPGLTYYLDTVAGVITTAAPGVVGNLVQEIGFGLDSESIWFNPVLNPYIV